MTTIRGQSFETMATPLDPTLTIFSNKIWHKLAAIVAALANGSCY